MLNIIQLLFCIASVFSTSPTSNRFILYLCLIISISDLVRSANSREVPSNMKMFPNDIVMAEHLTGGNPNILTDEAFLPEQKSDYKDLFGTKKSSGKKGKESFRKERDDWKSRKHSISPTGNKRISLPALPSTIPRPITHPRFITKALEGRSDHEVRVRIQIPPMNDCEEPEPIKTYQCYLCGFQTIRLNVIVFHNRSHSASFMEVEKANKVRLKAKERERVPYSFSSTSEKTPSTVTSRGRVKSLPKKLMDYSDEPPPKLLKEKIQSSKEHSESTIEKSVEKSPNKTPKKEKDNSFGKSIKRPLFGKRKSAKEKAEKAAKLKQENEAMKETLLKDWDDDDVNEEEVELERLKQALESTTTSNPDEDSTIISANDSDILKPIVDVTEKPTTKVKNKIIGSKRQQAGSKSDVKTIETKVFEFDDSEDSLPVEINFRLKNQREKFTDDKFKKPKPPKPLVKASPKTKVVPLFLPSPSPETVLKDDKEAAEFNEAFNNLLEETAVPVLPEIPKAAVSISKSDQISDQTSDISSSTDLMELSEETQTLNQQVSKGTVGSRQSYEEGNENSKIECTSSDTEQIITELSHSRVNQKNFKEVSENDPSAEMDVDLRSGVPTTSINNQSSLEFDSEQTCESLAVTEISSTCDLSKTVQVIEESLVQFESSNSSQTSIKTNTSGSPLDEFESVNTQIEKHTDDSENENLNTSSSEQLFNTKSTFERATVDVSKAVKDTFSETLTKYSEPSNVSCSKNQQNSMVSDQAQSVDISGTNESVLTFTSDGNYMDTEVVKEETVVLQDEQSTVISEEVVQQIPSHSDEQFSMQLTNNAIAQVISKNDSNFQMVLPYTSESESVQFTSHQQPIQSVQTIVQEISKGNQIKNQCLSQNLQDMELDINSMPVIIGGEDFIQPEQPKQNFVPIQPKYSESIVISPKSSPKKSERVIMHIGEPSTSNQNMQSVISLPNRGGRGGNRGGRVQKTTSKTIKLSANALKNLGLPAKGGNQQVLILKTTSSGQDKQGKGSVQKSNMPVNMFQHGNKILLINSSQVPGQGKLKLNTQQQLFSGGKLAPGTKFFASKMIATSTAQATGSPDKVSTSVSSPMPTQKLVISKGGMLTNTSKSMIINSSTGKLVPSTHTVTTSKGQAVITHNILTTKGGLILPSSSQSASPNVKTATINLTASQALSNRKNMIISPVTNKGDTIIAGNQKLRIVSSKAPLKGTRLVVQSSPGKIAIDPQGKGQQLKFISGLKGQTSGNTILIQTSQGLVAKSISPSSTTTAVSQQVVKQVDMVNTVLTNKQSPAKTRGKTALVYQPKVIQSKNLQQTQIVQKPQAVQHTQIVQQSQVIKTTPVVKRTKAPRAKQSPNILEKPPRKSTPRTPKSKIATAPEQTVTSNLPVITQSSLVQGDIPQTNEVVYLTVDESGNYRQVDKSLVNFEGNSSEVPQTIFIPANNQMQMQDVGSLLFALDDAGNIVNLTQPASSTSFSTENAVPSQDILAKALANTQVLQQETILPDIDVSLALSTSMDSTVLASSSSSDQSQYPPSLSHSVLETSLTLNQPIMTPLEVPSSVSSNFRQISSAPSSYISSNVMTANQKHLPPSMPLLTEESLVNQAGGESVFLLDNSNSIIPATSGSQISFQLTLGDNNVIMTSGAGGNVLPQTYQVVSSGNLPPQLVATGNTLSSFQKAESSSENELNSEGFDVVTNVSQNEQIQVEEQETLTLTDPLTASDSNVNNENLLNNIEISQHQSQSEDNLINEMKDEYNNDIVEQHCVIAEDLETIEYCSESVDGSSNAQDIGTFKIEEEEVKHSLKRSCEELEEAIVGLSDSDDNSKKMRIDER